MHQHKLNSPRNAWGLLQILLRKNSDLGFYDVCDGFLRSTRLFKDLETKSWFEEGEPVDRSLDRNAGADEIDDVVKDAGEDWGIHAFAGGQMD